MVIFPTWVDLPAVTRSTFGWTGAPRVARHPSEGPAGSQAFTGWPVVNPHRTPVASGAAVTLGAEPTPHTERSINGCQSPRTRGRVRVGRGLGSSDGSGGIGSGGRMPPEVAVGVGLGPP